EIGKARRARVLSLCAFWFGAGLLMMRESGLLMKGEMADRVSGAGVVAVVLAAGRGTRMGAITETLPKPLVPVLGRPALEWVVESLSMCGIRRFVIVTG